MSDQNSQSNSEGFWNTRWRPALAVVYMIINLADFVIFPVLWSILQASYKGQVTSQWIPITLQGAGLFHMAMGAILGVSAWTRGQEKIAGINNSSSMARIQSTPRTFPPVATGGFDRFGNPVD